MTEIPITVCRTIGQLIHDVRRSSEKTGYRVIFEDRQKEREFGFHLVDDTHAGVHEWRLPVKALLTSSPGLSQAVLDALKDMLEVRHTREIMAEWLSHRVSLEDAHKRARDYLVGIGKRAPLPEPPPWVPGVRLHYITNDVHGEVIPNVKMPGDICVLWESGQLISYDVETLNERVAKGVFRRL